jgi:F0F1-type ATP synthase membrane subunit b/b'
MSADPRNDFSVVRRGFDPEQVRSYIAQRDLEWESKLAGTAEYIDKIEGQLAEAKSREEAVHLTLVAATKTKEELLESAKRQLEEAKVRAQQEADEILANAKREAFEMVTRSNQDAEKAIEEARAEVERIRSEHGSLSEDARGEAEEIKANAQRDAEQILTGARSEAEATLANARSEALGMLSDIKEESERMIAERDKELERIRAAADSEASMTTERIQHLKTVAADLEQRLRLLAEGAIDEVVAINSDLHHELTEDPQLEQVIHQLEAHSAAATAAPIATEETEPSVEPADVAAPTTVEVEVPAADEATVQVIVDADDEGHDGTDTQDEPEEQAAAPMSEADVDRADLEADTARAPRGSFYSRRSARLPRIGADAASGALAAVSAMRSRARDEAGLASEGEPENSEDFAMQTA